MIVTCTMNPCLDWQLTVASFTHGGMNRVTSKRMDVAGKGVNVSVALKNLGADSLCLGINYEDNGAVMDRFLDAAHIAHDFVQAPGAIRTNIKLREADTGRMTEINQPGTYVPPECADAVLRKIQNARPDILVLSGSLPQGVAPDMYRRMAEAAGPHTVLIADAEGEALRQCADGPRPPFLIKPNLFELETAYGVSLRGPRETAAFCLRLTQAASGPRFVLCTMGADGAVLAGEGKAYRAAGLRVPVRGLPGAGDSSVAGFILAYTQGLPPAEMLACAVAAASASVMRDGTQLADRDGFCACRTQVHVDELDLT